MISSAEADAFLSANTPDFGIEEIALELAAGRVLRQDVRAERDQPPFDRVTMDGIAFSYDDGNQHTLPIAGRVLAGQAPIAVNHGECVEIMTGAVLPPGADTVVPIERIEISERVAKLTEPDSLVKGQFVHRMGSDHLANAKLLSAGAKIGAAEVAILASAACATVSVAKTPVVTIISTGDELVPAGMPIEAHQIRLSNGPAIAAALNEMGIASATCEQVTDQPDAIRLALDQALQRSDVLILSGGVSMGTADYVPGALEDLGCQRIFHRIRQRPGKPMWFGVSPAGQMIFALPGNPVSALVCHRRYVMPAIARAAGCLRKHSLQLPLAKTVNFNPELTAFIAVQLVCEDKIQAVRPVATNTSGDFAALGGTDGMVELAAEQDFFAAGTPVRYFPWRMP